MQSLLTPDDYDGLPKKPSAKWIALEKIARKRMQYILDSNPGDSIRKLTILQYMKTVSAAAKSTDVKNVETPTASEPTAHLQTFMTDVEAAVATILLGPDININDFGLKIDEGPKQRIRDLVSAIQSDIPNLELDARNETRLRESLSAFLSELEAPRSRFSVGSNKLLIALTVINLAVTSIAAGDDALKNIETIQTIWGEEHEKMEARQLGIPYVEPAALLPAPPKLIEKQPIDVE